MIMCEPKESKVNLPDYTATDNFVQTFSRLMRRLRWLGIPWGGGLAQQGVAQALLASIFIGILSAVNRLFVAVDFGKIFLRVAGTSKYASAFFALLMIRRLKRSWPALAGAWTTSNHTLGALILPDAGLTKTITTPVRVTAGKHLSWRKVREVFVRHAALVQATDRALGPLVLLSLFTNLLYILMLVFS
ncbi:hypothetical protein JYU34_011150 [Plutella xylostella]|uniref:Uncharacterized protein n=1 Tax=Plutella xylostella TaxID=51655 RepID=A0ABQ7QG97_PLUXY|nr:hypothetical protein JYU34_011150 [Plutella xylostella]